MSSVAADQSVLCAGQRASNPAQYQHLRCSVTCEHVINGHQSLLIEDTLSPLLCLRYSMGKGKKRKNRGKKVEGEI